MTYQRTQLSLPAHGSIAISLGMAMLVAPALIGFGVAGLVLSASLGAVEIGFGLTLTAPGRYVTAWRAHLDSLFALTTPPRRSAWPPPARRRPRCSSPRSPVRACA